MESLRHAPLSDILAVHIEALHEHDVVERQKKHDVATLQDVPLGVPVLPDSVVDDGLRILRIHVDAMGLSEGNQLTCISNEGKDSRWESDPTRTRTTFEDQYIKATTQS